MQFRFCAEKCKMKNNFCFAEKNDKSFDDELYYRDVFILLYISFIRQEEPFLYGKLIIEHFVKYQDIVKHYETI